MVESGSCCALLVAQLAAERREVTVITNSAFIASSVRDDPTVRVVLIGGIYQKDSQVMVGPMVRSCVEGFYVDLLFAGTDGFSARTGFTNSDQMRAASSPRQASRPCDTGTEGLSPLRPRCPTPSRHSPGSGEAPSPSRFIRSA